MHATWGGTWGYNQTAAGSVRETPSHRRLVRLRLGQTVEMLHDLVAPEVSY